jgi:hypothetical protein
MAQIAHLLIKMSSISTLFECMIAIVHICKRLLVPMLAKGSFQTCLTLDESQVPEDGIGRFPDGEAHGTVRVIALTLNIVIPSLTLTVEGPANVLGFVAILIPRECDAIASEEPDSALVLETDRHAVI